MIDFNNVRKSGLRQRGELDKLFGVSYPMVNRYLTGQSFPRGENRRLINVAVKVIDTLVAQGKLPLPSDRDAEARSKAVDKISAFIQTKLH